MTIARYEKLPCAGDKYIHNQYLIDAPSTDHFYAVEVSGAKILLDGTVEVVFTANQKLPHSRQEIGGKYSMELCNFLRDFFFDKPAKEESSEKSTTDTDKTPLEWLPILDKLSESFSTAFAKAIIRQPEYEKFKPELNRVHSVLDNIVALKASVQCLCNESWYKLQ